MRRRLRTCAGLGSFVLVSSAISVIALRVPPVLSARFGGGKGTGSESLEWALPQSAVGRQLSWLVTAADHPPIPAAAVRRHFDAKFLDAVSPATLNRAIPSVHAAGRWRIVALDASTSPDFLAADVVSGSVRIGVEIGVDHSGLIELLYFQPATALPRSPSTWTAVDREASSLAPDVGFEAATIDRSGQCGSVNAIAPDTQRPLGSMFKLFVLGAIANGVKAGKINWSESVPLTSSERSLPSGLFQVDPIGTRYSVDEVAQQMIASSDNTAADMLLALAGRQAVESQTHQWMEDSASDFPFLTPREFFVLKFDRFPALANHYLSLDPGARLEYLDNVIDNMPISQVSVTNSALASPRAIDSIEWFASPSDICRAFAGLYSFSRLKVLAPLGDALSLNDGGLRLPDDRWNTVWFKGGSETGVLTLGYLARRSDGRVAVVVLELSDPRAALAESTLAPRALAVVRGAFSLLS